MTEPRILFLIRHGRSDQTSNDLIETPRGMQWDPPLDDLGREQASRLARRLRLMAPPAAVYSSPLRRARQTAAPAAAAWGLEARVDDDLMEAHIGEWENTDFEDILASDPEIMHLFRRQRAIWSRAPGGEAWDPFRKRVHDAVESILARHPSGDLVVVAHGGVINAYLWPLVQVENEMFFLPENTSLNSVEVEGSERRVRFLNDVVHLSDPHLFEP
jgi:broad specificity phosphatase PhoE